MSTTGRGASERVIAAGFDAISLFCDPSPKKCAEGAMNLHRTLHMLQTQTDCQARVAELDLSNKILRTVCLKRF